MKKQFLLSVALLCALISFGQRKYDAFTVSVTGKGTPMLFIPGATCSGDEWKETVKRYEHKYQCHVFTLAGYAGAPPMSAAPPYLETYRNAIMQYIADNKLQHVILVGHSIGGFLAMWIAADMRDHLQKVIIVDAMPFLPATRDSAAKSGFNETIAKGALDRYNAADTAQLRMYGLMMAKSMCSDSARYNEIAGWGMHSDKKTMAYTMTEMMGTDLRDTVARIKVPVLVMGAYSPAPQYPQFTRESAAASYKEQYSQCTACKIDMADSRHFIMYDVPAWYNKEMDTFLDNK